MATEKREYGMNDLVEQDRDAVPSLDLPDIIVEKWFKPKDNGKFMLICANQRDSVYPTDERCLYCQEKTTWVRAGNLGSRLVHDVDRDGYRVDIAILPRRFACRNCGFKITPSLRGTEENKQLTTRLLEFLRRECLIQPIAILSERSGVSEASIQDLLEEEIARLDEKFKANPFLAPRVLGIDEKHIEYELRGVLVDVESGSLLNMLKNNRPDTMKTAIQQLKDWDTRIEVVTMDMSRSYISWVPSFLPNATVVIDKFHVVQDVQKRITTTAKKLHEYRSSLIKGIEDPAEKARQRGILNLVSEERRLFNYSMDTLTKDEKSDLAKKVATVIAAFPEYRQLRELYYGLELVYQQKTYEDAERMWDAWTDMLPPEKKKDYEAWCRSRDFIPSLFDDFRTFRRDGFARFKPYILNYFKDGCRHTNAATEGLNRKIDEINNKSYGLSFKVLRAKCLYGPLVKERVKYGIKSKSILTWKPTYRMSFDGRDRSERTIVAQPVFTTSTEKANIPTINIYTDNKEVLSILEASAKNEGNPPLLLQRDLLRNFGQFFFDHYEDDEFDD